MSLQILELHRDIVRISGDDNRAFLQGQVTCDVDKITKTKAIRGALCNIKGRVIADFIAPTPEARSLFPADYIVWVDTIKKGRFEDTNQMFVNPKNFDFHVTSQDAKKWAPKIIEEIKKGNINGITKNLQHKC